MSLSIKETAEFCRLCQEGMFVEVVEWIGAGKDTAPHPRARQDPLCIAAGKGFHSLVKLLCDRGATQAALDGALAAAGANGNLEATKLLLQRGATVTALDTRKVCSSPNPEIVGVCIAAGADFSTDTPLARELICESVPALRCFERWRTRIPTIRDQGAMALITAVRDGEESWVTRLIRAGASPRHRVRELGPQYEIRYPLTALEQAARKGSFKMLLRLGVRKTDDLQGLLLEACWEFDMTTMKFLIKRGAKLNDRANGGSSVLQKCLWEMGTWHHLGVHARAYKAWDAIVALAEMGARWIPDRDELSSIRSGFKHAGTLKWVEFAALMMKTKAADRATLGKLFGTRWMKERLISRRKDDMAAALGERWWQPSRWDRPVP